MDFGLIGVGRDEPACGYGPSNEKMVRMPTLKDRLAEFVARAEAQLADAKRAKEIFDAHPELEELLNIMQRGRF